MPSANVARRATCGLCVTAPCSGSHSSPPGHPRWLSQREFSSLESHATDARPIITAATAHNNSSFMAASDLRRCSFGANADSSIVRPMSDSSTRPAFIIAAGDLPESSFSYPNSTETFAFGRAIGKAAGLLQIGLHYERLPPGKRTSWPHAEEKEEEFVYVIEGEVLAWVDGHVHAMRKGDLAAFPAGTGIAHVFINDSDSDAILLVGGERSKPDNRIVYPLNPSRASDERMAGAYWTDAPAHELGPHDGLPKKR